MRDYEAKKFLNLSKPEQAAYIRGVCHTLVWVGIIIAALLVVFAGMTAPITHAAWEAEQRGAKSATLAQLLSAFWGGATGKHARDGGS